MFAYAVRGFCAKPVEERAALIRKALGDTDTRRLVDQAIAALPPVTVPASWALPSGEIVTGIERVDVFIATRQIVEALAHG